MLGARFFRIVVIALVIILTQAACELPFSVAMKDQADTNTIDNNQPATEGETTTISTEEPDLSDDEQELSTSEPIPSVKQSGPAAPTPVIYQGRSPSAGSGGVYGRILWNGKPVEGLEVKLCDEIKFIGGCEGLEYPTNTGKDGVYVLLDVPPGTYGLTFRAIDSDTWYYITSMVLNSKDFEIPADQMINMGDNNTIRTDVVILTPQEDERLSISRPTLSWEPYPEAAYYELTFHSGRAGSMISSRKITTTSFLLDRDLQTCDYSFDIEVFNSQEEIIAEYDGWRNFEVGGMPTNCKMIALTPVDGATVSANNIILSWEPHAWAATYKIHLYLKSDYKQKVLDFVETTETSYTVTQNVPAGEYEWVVYGYDEFGESVGFAETFTLYVTNP